MRPALEVYRTDPPRRTVYLDRDAGAMTTGAKTVNQRAKIHCLLLIFGILMGFAVGNPSAGSADPDEDSVSSPPSVEPEDSPPPSQFNPFPNFEIMMLTYDRHEPGEFFTATQDFTASKDVLWFQAPGGLSCAIWDRGSFGCEGDIRGATPGTTHIGWVSGDIVIRHDPVSALRFPPGQAERPLPPRSYVSYLGTTCGVTADTTYCVRGPYQFLITPNRTWLRPP